MTLAEAIVDQHRQGVSYSWLQTNTGHESYSHSNDLFNKTTYYYMNDDSAIAFRSEDETIQAL